MRQNNLWDQTLEENFLTSELLNNNNNKFWRSSEPLSENKRKQKTGQIQRPCQRTKKMCSVKMTVKAILDEPFITVPNGLEISLGETDNQREK